MSSLYNQDETVVVGEEGCQSPIVISPYKPIKLIRVVLSKGSQGKPGPQGPPGGGLGYETAATYSTISSNTADRFIRVNIDETNNGDKSLYLYTKGIGLEFIQTIA